MGIALEERFNGSKMLPTAPRVVEVKVILDLYVLDNCENLQLNVLN